MNPVSSPLPEPVAAVVLAAGAATRMGHRPKCLLEIAGQPVLLRQLAALRAAGVASVHVVLGYHADRVAQVLAGEPVSVVRHVVPEPAQSASLHLGLQALPGHVQTVLVALADQPLIDASDVRDLLAAYACRPAGTQLVRPMVGGLPGNPVVFSRDVVQALCAAGPDVGGQAWQARHPSLVHHWDTPNAHYRMDLDTEEDVAVFARQTGLRVAWPPDLRGD